MPSQPGLQLRPSDTYLAAVERCEAIVDPHPQYIAGERNMKCDGPIEILGWNSNKCIRYSICAVSDLPACIEADLPSNQSLAEQSFASSSKPLVSRELLPDSPRRREAKKVCGRARFGGRPRFRCTRKSAATTPMVVTVLMLPRFRQVGGARRPVSRYTGPIARVLAYARPESDDAGKQQQHRKSCHSGD